jgi:hypothetical protein
MNNLRDIQVIREDIKRDCEQVFNQAFKEASEQAYKIVANTLCFRQKVRCFTPNT